MKLDELKALLYTAEDAVNKVGEQVCNEIYHHPELGDDEHYSAKYITDEMKKMGFTVQIPYCGVPTAFRCEYGDDDGPKVAFLAEYDALPGYGPNKDQLGHACGHNWISGSTVAACAALKQIKQHFKGKIVLIGTPAEETDGRKIDIMEAGGFDDLDCAIQLHLGESNAVECVALACTDVTFDFKGFAVHASSHPDQGINALDACQLTFAGVNALRQHVTSDVRIHGIIKEGGSVCNTVPDRGSMQLFVRAANKDYLENVVERVVNCAKGAELMTGATLTHRRAKNTFYDYKMIPELQEKLRSNMKRQGFTDFVKDDLYHSGSTDIGNVSYACPTVYGYVGTGTYSSAKPHDVEYLNVVNSPYAYDLLHKAAKSMAATALDIFCDAEFREQIKYKNKKIYYWMKIMSKKMNFKKALPLLLILTMMLTAFTGCSSKTATATAASGNTAATAAKTEPANLLEKIKADGKLQVITEPYFAPYEFIDSSKSGQEQYLGADMKLAKYIADSLGVELEIIPLEWSAVLTGISTGKYEMAISGMGYTAERAEAMSLSDSYRDEDSRHGFVVKASDVALYPELSSFDGKKIAFQKGTLQEMYSTAQLKDFEAQPYDSVQNAILALQSGKADAVAVSYENGELFVEANPDLAMATPLFQDTKDSTIVAMPKGETELTEAVNKILAEVNEKGLYGQWWDEATEQAKSLGVSQ